jgi:hypothetical protein
MTPDTHPGRSPSRLDQQALHETCRGIYRDMAALYAELGPSLARDGPAPGYAILFGPPRLRPPILFVGYQPGGPYGPVPDAASPTPWPLTSQYAACSWRLALRLQDIYGKELLARCTGLNAIFVRARSSTHYKDYPSTARQRIEAFCIPACRRLIEAMQPEKVVVLGLGSLGLLGKAGQASIATGAKGRWLVCDGTVASRPVTAVLHPTGAFGLSAEEWDVVKRHLAG